MLNESQEKNLAAAEKRAIASIQKIVDRHKKKNRRQAEKGKSQKPETPV